MDSYKKSPSQKLFEYKNFIRRRDHETYFSQRRMEMLAISTQQTNNQQNSISSFSDSQEILQYIAKCEQDRVGIDFNSINNFIAQCPITSIQTKEFQLKIVQTILTNLDFLKIQSALALIGNIIHRSDCCIAIGDYSQVSEVVKTIFDLNFNEQTQKIYHSRAICWLIAGLSSSKNQKYLNYEQFSIVPQFYENLASTIGLLDSVFLQMMIQLGKHSELHPKVQFLQTLLKQNLKDKDSNVIERFIELLSIYAQSSKAEQLKEYFLILIKSAIVNRALSKYRQNTLDLLRILLQKTSIVLNLMEPANFQLIKTVCNLAKFSLNEVKFAAHIVLSTLITCSEPSEIDFFVEKSEILEIIIYALEINNENIKIRSLNALSLIIQANKSHMQKMINLQIQKYLFGLASNTRKAISNQAQNLMDLIDKIV